MIDIVVTKQACPHGEFIQVDHGDRSLCMTKDDAIILAAQLAFMASGYMVKTTNNGRIVEWNMLNQFFYEYAKLMGLKW